MYTTQSIIVLPVFAPKFGLGQLQAPASYKLERMKANTLSPRYDKASQTRSFEPLLMQFHREV